MLIKFTTTNNRTVYLNSQFVTHVNPQWNGKTEEQSISEIGCAGEVWRVIMASRHVSETLFPKEK